MKDNAYSSYSRQFVDSLDTKIVLQALQSKFITQGEYVKKFEKKFSKIVNSKFACAVNNCTSGLYIVSKCLELNRNSYAWTTKDFNPQSENKEYEIVSKNKVFYPWKLIFKK